jgi:NhaP-type Na+/H+ or K+/H+ antiporter
MDGSAFRNFDLGRSLVVIFALAMIGGIATGCGVGWLLWYAFQHLAWV